MPSQNIESITWKDAAFKDAKHHLSQSRNERVVFGFGSVIEKKGRKRVIVKGILTPEDEDYLVSNPVHVKLNSPRVNQKIKSRENNDERLVVSIHSQPMVEPSGGDVNTAVRVVEFYPDLIFGTFCHGTFRFWHFVGGNRMRLTPWKIMDTERYDRQIKVFGEDGQLRLAASRVVCVGCGGGMFKAIVDLTLSGVGSITIIDPDVLDESNLARIPFGPEYVGIKKVEAASRFLKGLRPDLDLTVYDGRVQSYDQEEFARHDVVVVGTDNVLSRIYCNRLAVQNQIPCVFLGAGIKAKDQLIEKVGGNCRVAIPGKTNCYECNKSFTPEQLQLDYIPPDRIVELRRQGYGITEHAVPSIAALNSIVAGIGVWEVQKLLTGAAEPVAYTYFDALTNRVLQVKEPRDTNCLTCAPYWPSSDKAHDPHARSFFKRLYKRFLKRQKLDANEK